MKKIKKIYWKVDGKDVKASNVKDFGDGFVLTMPLHHPSKHHSQIHTCIANLIIHIEIDETHTMARDYKVKEIKSRRRWW